MSQPLCSETTAKGEPCRNPAVVGETLCGAHLGLAHRPLSFDEEQAGKLLAILRTGNYLAVACRSVGLAETTFRQWLTRGRDEDEADERLRRFRESVEEARAQGEVRNVAAIARAAAEDWKAAAWLLERQHPERWGKTSVRARDEAPPEPLPATVNEFDDPFAEVDELSARRGRTA